MTWFKVECWVDIDETEHDEVMQQIIDALYDNDFSEVLIDKIYQQHPIIKLKEEER